jgi:hypothetical protein
VTSPTHQDDQHADDCGMMRATATLRHPGHRCTGTSWASLRPLRCRPCYNATITDKPTRPEPTPRPPLVLPPNFRDVTAEKIGTVIGIVGAMAAKATKPG